MKCSNCELMKKTLKKISAKSRTSVWTYGGGDETWEARLADEVLEKVKSREEKDADGQEGGL